jgi:methyltransferase (TIGR00027 family)
MLKGLEPMVERMGMASRSEPLIRNISDTALWVAVYRARETERPDALFSDPLARKLAGERGEQIARSMQFGERHAWSYVARTWLVDGIVTEQLKQGTDMVVNLAAGLDTRPYRMDLPRSLRWIEVDLPAMIDYKEQVLGGEKAACELKRVRLDLSNLKARREVFAELGRSAAKVLLLSEGLVIYLTRDEVDGLARDLARQPSFQNWVLDLVSPGLLKMLQRNLGASLSAAGSPLKFGPEEGPEFFLPYGWKPTLVHSLLKTAARLKRLSLGMRLVALLPQSNGRQGSRPWGATCLLTRG